MKKAGDIVASQTVDLLDGITDTAMKKTLSRLQQTLNDPRTKAKQARREAEVLKRPSAPQSAQIIQLPLWPEPVRGVPNSALRGALFAAIQGKNRKALKGELLAVQRGIEIRFTGWQLDQSDLDVWEQALHLARQHPLGTRCYFTAHAFLKGLGRSTGKPMHEWLKDVFRRLGGGFVEITDKGYTYGGGMLRFYRDEERQLYALEIDPQIRKLFTAGWTATDWEQRQLLRRKPLALWLQGFYATHAKPYPVTVQKLWEWSGSWTKTIKHFKANLKKALNELQAVGAIDSYSIDGDLVSVKRSPSNSQIKHLRKAKPRKK